MSFKPYCAMCGTWHTDQESHIVEPLVTKCPGCGEPVTSYWMKNNTGCISRPEYTLIADWIYHSPCWDEQVKNYNPEPTTGATNDPTD